MYIFIKIDRFTQHRDRTRRSGIVMSSKVTLKLTDRQN